MSKRGEGLSAAEFAALSPRDRGYAVYMLGARADQPNVPDERNPYEPASPMWRAWNEGQRAAALAAQDSEE